MKEIQVILNMKDYGYDLFPFTEKTPKQLLPVANKPFLAYLLETLSNHYFTEFIFLCNKEKEDIIKNYVENKFSWPRKLKYNLNFYSPDHYDADAKLIAELYQKNILTRDFLLINAESLSSINLNQLVDFHYANDNDITSCFIQNSKSQQFLILQSENKNIMKFLDKEQLDLDKTINLSEACVLNNQKMEFLRGYQMVDVHLCSINVAKIIVQVQQKLDEFGEEVLPFIIDNQYNKRLMQEYNGQTNDDTSMEQSNSTRTIPLPSKENLSEKLKPIQVKPFLFNGVIDCIKNIQEYKEINQKSIGYQRTQKMYQHTENNQPNQNLDKNQGQVKFSIVAKNTTIGKNSKIERSVIGQNCRIEDSNIKNCTLMDDVIIEKDVTLENSLVGSEVYIPSGMTVRNCYLGDKLIVDKNEQMLLEDERLSILDNPVEVIRKNSECLNQLNFVNIQIKNMNNLDQLINFCKEFLVNKPQKEINENIYHNLTEATERFTILIIQEYKNMFDKIRCKIQVKQELQMHNQTLKKYLKVINMFLFKQRNSMKNQLLDTISINEVDKFWNYDFQNLLSGILCLEVNYKEFLELEHKMNQCVFENYNTLQNTNNKDKNLLVRLQKDFCEELVENYEELNQKINQENVKEFFQKKNFQVFYKIEQFLQVLQSNQYIQFLQQRMALTFEILNDLDKIKIISCSLYGDKIMKVEENSELKKKKFSFTDNKWISFTKSKSKNISFCLSKIRGNNISQDVNSLAEEINLLLKDRRESHLFNKYSKLEYEDLDEDENEISQTQENSIKQMSQKNEILQNRGFCSYCHIF